MSSQNGVSWLSRSIIIGLFASLLALTLLAVPTIAAEDSSAVTGLYDDAGVFSEQEHNEIETAIDRVEAAGAPTVVYLRLFDPNDDRAVEDGLQLMEEWDVQSESGARDGVVVFFNVDPEDTNRGEFGVVAGETHFDDGALPQSRLNDIRDEMIDLLVDDRMADAIVLGLEMTADYLESGPPEPTAFELFVEDVATGPISLLNAIALLVTALLGIVGWRTWRDRPQADQSYREKTTTPPSDMHPVLAGALVQGTDHNSQVEALMLDLARNGAIALEPVEDKDKEVRVRILNQRSAFTSYELELLSILVEQADDDQTLDQNALQKTQMKWGQVRERIREDLEENGSFDPDAGRKKAPLWVIGLTASPLGILVAIIPLATIDEAWSFIGGGVLALLGAVLVFMAASYRRTTPEGERQSMPWRGYRDGLQEAANDDYGSIDLDEAFPYIVSMGLTNDFNKHMEAASDAGYIPAWIVANEYQRQAVGNNWFIYWGAFHTSMQSSSSSGAGAGGAAGGGGGAGGRF